jgi:hypothetical protein
MVSLRVWIPDGILAQAKALRKEGMAWEAIAARIGFHKETVRRRLDPEFRVRTARAKAAKARADKDSFNAVRRSLSPHSNNVGRPPLNADELRARRSLIPLDTRDNTGRLLGDPIPGDRRRSA